MTFKEKFLKNYDKILLIGLYICLIGNSLFLIFGVQNVFAEYISSTNVLYLVDIIAATILACVSAYYISKEKKSAELFTNIGLLAAWGFYYYLILQVTLFIDVDGGMLYRNWWSILFFFVLIIRTMKVWWEL